MKWSNNLTGGPTILPAKPMNLEFGGLFKKREIQTNTWSRGAMAECRIPDPQKVHQLEKTWIWDKTARKGKAIVVNACLRLFRERGYRFP